MSLLKNFIKKIKNIKVLRSKMIMILAAISAALFSFVMIISIKIYREYDVELLKNQIENGYSVSLLDENENIIGVYINKEEQWHIKSPYKIPENLKLSVLTFEDKNFDKHNGIDFLALMRAIKNNFLGKKKSGASTITMQVAKIISPKQRNYSNKFREMIASIKLENNMTKEEILSLYLNNAPYGGNIVGYGTASELYFRKKPEKLTWAEAALLAVLPNSPGLINVERNSEALIEKRNNLLKRLHEKKYMDDTQYRLSVNEPIPKTRYPFKNLAPHLGRRLSRGNPDKIFHTTIDGPFQERIEKVVKDYADFTAIEGISNISLLIIENETNNVKVYVGSQDFLDFDKNGQVDGIIAKRSPGSILKPFLYALSIDQGLVAPQSKVPDVPLYFSNFSPQNASKRYSGMVEMRQALIRSLNIPFVHLLQEYGDDKFFYFLKDAVEFNEDNPDQYGLSLILGTKEMSPEEVGILYSGLANYGRFKKLNYLQNNSNEEATGKKLISSGASYLTLQTIKNLSRPGITDYYRWRNPISWKTGTSYGRRDAWACGVTPEYTVIVWVGNFTGASNNNLSGVVSAGRLLFNVFNEISIKNNNFDRPEDLYTIKVDKLTGYRNEFPQVETQDILYPRSAKPLKLSPYYKRIFVNDVDEEIDSRSPDFINRKEKIVINYPLEVINYLIRENMDVSSIYDENLVSKRTIKIIYPTNNLSILLPKDFDGENNVIVKIANIRNQDVYWYLDNEFLGKDKEYQKEIKIPNGERVITIMSETGEIERVRFNIQRTQ